MTENFERIVEILPAFDKRKEGYGIHGCDMRMVLKGEKGAVGFTLYTNWMLPHVEKELDAKIHEQFPHLSCHPLPADLGYHSPTPHYEGQKSMGPCEYLNGEPCYYDGSGLNAENIYHALLSRGSDGVWEELERCYNGVFHNAEWSLPPLLTQEG
jgi:hypothetical protein